MLLERIRSVHRKSRMTYGSPRVHRQLVSEGVACSRGRVERLMSANDIRAKQRRKFVVQEPNKVWASDITYISTQEGWQYLASVMDLCSRTAVGWSMSDSLERTLALDALKTAYHRGRPADGLIHHSDRGSQYASEDYCNLLTGYGMLMRMSCKGDCWDNAPMESIFSTL